MMRKGRYIINNEYNYKYDYSSLRIFTELRLENLFFRSKAESKDDLEEYEVEFREN